MPNRVSDLFRIPCHWVVMEELICNCLVGHYSGSVISMGTKFVGVKVSGRYTASLEFPFH